MKETKKITEQVEGGDGYLPLLEKNLVYLLEVFGRIRRKKSIVTL